MKLDKIAFVDLETTGCSPNHDRIIEIGILRIENNKLVEKFRTLVNPQMHLSPFITDLTGIKPENLEDAPLFENIKEDVLNILDDCVFAAHNVRFDYGFIKQELKRFEIPFSAKLLCTAKLSRILYPQHTHHNLDSLILRHNFYCKNRHRAYDDAKIIWDFYQLTRQEFDSKTFQQAVNKVMKKPTLPPNLSQEDLDTLPETTGVYIFYGEKNIPLYIGKSKNIRDRVLSHFSSDITSVRRMNIARQVNRIEVKRTGGELSALLLESSLIKSMLPLYNRQLRISKKLVILKQKTNSLGYYTTETELVNEIKIKDLKNILGIFKSKKQIKEYLTEVTKEKSLCHKLLGLEKSKSSCFPYKLGGCKGACINKEKPIRYNLRFITAFTEKKIRKWPFTGPVLIKEINEDHEEILLADKWCLLKSNSNHDYNFDYDIYKILYSYLKNPHNLKSIQTISRKKLLSAKGQSRTDI